MIDWRKVLTHVKLDSRRSLYFYVCRPSKFNCEQGTVAIAVKPCWFHMVLQDQQTIRSAFEAEFGKEFRLLLYPSQFQQAN